MVADFLAVAPASRTLARSTALVMAALVSSPPTSRAQQPETKGEVRPQLQSRSEAQKSTPSETYGKLLQVPTSDLVPGAISVHPNVKNPVGSDPAAAQRGMRYFSAFNCVGCHMSNGGGGMGPALSRRPFTYGDAPANIYLSIVQGRSNGMPAWGSILPEEVVWDLVAYIGNLSDEPKTREWGTTISRSAQTIEQVPAEFQATAKPWGYTNSTNRGQKP
jgi:cytochrome c oxidase cbb3-type subunit 3